MVGTMETHAAVAKRLNNYYGEDGSQLVLGNKGTVIRIVDNVTYQPQGRNAAGTDQTPSQVGGEPNIVGSDEVVRLVLRMVGADEYMQLSKSPAT